MVFLSLFQRGIRPDPALFTNWYDELCDRVVDWVTLRFTIARYGHRLDGVYSRRFMDEQRKAQFNTRTKSTRYKRSPSGCEPESYSYNGLIGEYRSLLEELSVLEQYEQALMYYEFGRKRESKLDYVHGEMIYIWMREAEMRPKIAERESPRRLFKQYNLLFLP